MAMVRNILITGSYCSLNNGDLAMFKGCVDNIKKMYPEINITVFSMYPNVTPERYGVHVKGISIEPKRIYLIRFGWLCLSSFLYIFFKDLIPGFLYGKDFNEYKKADLIIDLSGDGYSDEMGTIATILHSLYLLPAIAMKKKLYVCAQSIGPFIKWYSKIIAKWTLNRASIITSRELITKEYLDRILYKKNMLTADCAFLMEPRLSQRLLNIVKKYNLESNKIIGLSVSKRMTKWAFPDIKNEKYETFIKLITIFVDKLIEKYNINVLFVPHVMGPPGKVDDRLVQRDIFNKINNKEKVILIEEELMPDEMKAIIGYSYVFIGARMHSLIAATSMGVPVIAMGYSHKYEGVIGKMMDMHVVDLKKTESTQLVDMLNNKINTLMIENQLYRKKLDDSIIKVKNEAMKNLILLEEWLK